MNNLQKLGSITAFIHAAAYLIGIGLYLSILSPVIDANPAEYVALLADYQTLMYFWIFIAYWVSGFCLVVVALALYQRLNPHAPAMMQIATALGLIWAALIIGSGNLMLLGFIEIAKLYENAPAQAETVWLALRIVENGIVSANELIGGIWVFLLSGVALRSGEFPKALNIFGLIIGVAGIISIVPLLAEVGTTIFGLSMIVWFAWLGVVLWRK